MTKNLEKNIIFPISRFITLLSIVIVLIVIVYVIFPENSPVSIKYDDVKEKILEKNKTSKTDEKSFLVFPESILDAEDGNKSILTDWLDSIPEEYHQDFLDTLGHMYEKGANHDEISDIDMVNTYQKMVFEKINNRKTGYEKIIEDITKTITLLASLFIFLLLSNLLAILAVERNTRK